MKSLIQNTGKTFNSESILVVVLSLMTIVFPVLFFNFLNIEHTKTAIIYLVVSLSLILFLIPKLKEVKFNFGWNIFTFGVFIFIVSQLLVSIFSSVPHIAVWGRYFDPLSWVSIFVNVCLVFIIAHCIKKQNSVLLIQTSVIFSFVLWFAFFVSQKFLGGFILNRELIGLVSYKETAIFAGLVLLITMFLSLIKEGSKVYKTLIYIALFSSLSIVFVNNLVFVWYPIMAVALVSFVFFITFGRKYIGDILRFPAVLLVVFFLGFFSILSSGLVSFYVQAPLGINYLEVEPTYLTLKDVTVGVLSKDLLFGVGANRFSEAWSLYGSSNIYFTFGKGMITTIVSTTGIIGIIGFLFICLAFGFVIFKLIKNLPYMKREDFIVSTINLMAFGFLVLMAFFFVFGSFTLMLLVLFAGLILRDAYANKILKIKTFSILKYPQFGFVYVILIVGLILAFSFGIYRYSLVYISSVYANSYVNSPDINKLIKATSFYKTDEYANLASEFYFFELDKMIQTSNGGSEVNQEYLKQVTQNLLESSSFSYSYDPYSLSNILYISKAYFRFNQIGIKDSAEFLDKVLEDSRIRMNQSQNIIFIQAEVAYMKGDYDSASNYLGELLDKNPDFTDAILLSANISSIKGNSEQAISMLEAAVLKNSQEPKLFSRLGLEYFSNYKYDLAAASFFRAAQLDPNNLDNFYLMSVSFYMQGDKENALKIMRDLYDKNNQNVFLKEVLDQMESGTFNKSPDEKSEEKEEL